MSLQDHHSDEFDLTRTPAAAQLVVGVVSGDPELHLHHQSTRLAPSYSLVVSAVHLVVGGQNPHYPAAFGLAGG